MSRREVTQRELDELLSSQALPPLPGDRLKQIETALTANLKPVRPLAAESVYLAGFAIGFIALCAIGCYFAGQSGWHALNSVQKLCVFAPLGACAALLVFSIVRQMTPAAKHVRSSAVLSAGAFLLLFLMMAVIFRPVHELEFVRTGVMCFRTGMTFAIPAAFLFALLLLRGAALSPALTGVTAGGLAGLVGLAVLEIRCPDLNVYHIVAWHVSVPLVCVMGSLVFVAISQRRVKS
jgi:hypothetical protein